MLIRECDGVRGFLMSFWRWMVKDCVGGRLGGFWGFWFVVR